MFQDNVKAWSGDHCIDPRLVPGVLFCSRRIDEDDPALIDIAPTALRLFGVEPPAYMEGKPLFRCELPGKARPRDSTGSADGSLVRGRRAGGAPGCGARPRRRADG